MSGWRFHPIHDPFEEMGDCGYMAKWGWFYAGSIAFSFSFFFSGVPMRFIRGMVSGYPTSRRTGKLVLRQLRTFAMLTTFFTLIITIFGTVSCIQTGNAHSSAGKELNSRQAVGRWIRR